MSQTTPKVPSAATHDQSLGEAPGRSRADLLLWVVPLIYQHKLPDYGFHTLVWEHDPGCPLDPDGTELSAWSRCRCQPDATLVVNIGLVTERRIPLISEGVPLPAEGAH